MWECTACLSVQGRAAAQYFFARGIHSAAQLEPKSYDKSQQSKVALTPTTSKISNTVCFHDRRDRVLSAWDYRHGIIAMGLPA